ncbi:MAG: exodeoxyribonuclease, partial [Streptococcus sp.]
MGKCAFFWYNIVCNLNEKGNFMKLISWNIDSLNA